MQVSMAEAHAASAQRVADEVRYPNRDLRDHDHAAFSSTCLVLSTQQHVCHITLTYVEAKSRAVAAEAREAAAKEAARF